MAELAGIANARPEEVISVIEAFRQPGRSFLMPPTEVELDEQTLIDISHESLIRGWRRLSEWVESEALSAAIYKRVAETAVLYDKGLAGLWHDPDLQVALGWQGKVNPTEAWGRRYHPGFPSAMNFLSESVAARDRELLQQEMRRVKEFRRTRTFAAVLAVLLIMASALGVWAMAQTRKAKQQEARANEEAAKAVAAKNDAERAKAEAVSAREEAIRKRDEAEASKKIADQKTLEAQTNLVAAQEANRRAEENLAKAETAAKEARKQEIIARNRYAQFRDAVNRENEQTQTNMGTIDFLSNELINSASPRKAVQWRTLRASALTNIGQHKKAEEELTSALEIEPNNVDARMSRGYMYMLTDRIPQSIEDFDRIIAVDPNSSLAYLNKAISQGIVGDYNGASSSVKAAIDTYMPGTYSSSATRPS